MRLLLLLLIAHIRPWLQDQLARVIAGHVEVAQHRPRPVRNYVGGHHQFVHSKGEFNDWKGIELDEVKGG